MAIQTGSTTAAEHDWYAIRSGLTSGTLNEHKAKYYSDKGFGGATKPLSQMEAEWIASLTGVDGTHGYADQWREAVAGQGLTPSVNVDQNKFIFYTGVAGSP